MDFLILEYVLQELTNSSRMYWLNFTIEIIFIKGDYVNNLSIEETNINRKKYSRKFSESKLVGVFIRLTKSPKGLFGLIVLLALVIMAVFAEQLSPFDPIELHLKDKLQMPNATYWFGTDELGRDIFSRIIHGADISLEVGLLAVVLGAFVGVSTGLIAGYTGGAVDSVIMRWWDTILAFPAIFLGIALVAILGPDPMVAVLAVGINTMPTLRAV